MAKKGKEFNKENVIQTLRNHFGLNWDDRAKELNKLDNPDTYTGEQLRSYCRRDSNSDWYSEFKRKKGSHIALTNEMHRNPNNTISKNVIISRADNKLYTQRELLELHSLDPDGWVVVNAKSNEWSTSGDEPFYNYQSKLSVRPKTAMDLTPKEIIEQFKNLRTVTYDYKLKDKHVSDYLLIPLADMHIGLNSFEDYEQLQSDIIHIIKNGYKEILFLQLGDFFHVDNLNGTTVNQTNVVNGLEFDFKRMIEDGDRFIQPLLKEALEHSKIVKYVYSKGNHASSPDFMFAHGIKMRYPQIKVDDEIKEFKCTMLGKNAILQHHSDKVKAFSKLVSVFYANYGFEMGSANNRYLFTGHFHHEKSLSDAGITHYQVQSPSKHTNYEKDFGFNTSESGQMIFEFDENKRKGIYYL